MRTEFFRVIYFYEGVDEMKKSTKGKVLIFAALVAVITIVAVFMIMTRVASAQKITEQLELGDRYMSELDYDSAILAYRNAIELDSKCTDAYFALADAYEAMGDLTQAVAVLEEGYAQTGSETMSARLEEIKEVIRQQEEETARLAEVIDWKDANLEAVMREITGIADRDIVVGDVIDITELDLRSRAIVNIEALAMMENLEILYISNLENRIGDITPLNALKKLHTLWLCSQELDNLNGLKTCVEIKELHLISLWNVHRIDAISELVNIEVLDITGMEIDDLDFLVQLKKMRELQIFSSKVLDYSSISKLTNLEKLKIVTSSFTDCNLLKELTNLKELTLAFEYIDDISALSGLHNLEYLYFGGTTISDVTPLASLKKIKKLDLSGTKVIDYSPVEFIEQNGGEIIRAN